MRLGLLSLAALIPAFVSSCGGSSGGGGAAVQPTGPETTLKGTWQFEKVPAGPNGLDYSKTQLMPIRNAVVQLIKVADGSEAAAGTTNDKGEYALTYKGSGKVKVRVQAKTAKPVNILVEDNVNKNALWVSDSAEIEITTTGTVKATVTRNFVAKSGWGGDAYTAPRAAAPFNILDRCQLASEKILAARPDIKIPDLKVNWSTENKTVANSDTNTATGVLNASFYDGKELYILGQADVDTDEYDDHTLVHEWGHFFEATVTRSDNLGGHHSNGDILDPSVAFGEGFGYGIAAAVLTPNIQNVDSTGKKQASGAGNYSLEDNDVGDPKPGFFSERSIQYILYDLFDDTNEAPHDSVALGLKPILDVLTGAQKTTDARTSIFSFLHALKAANPGAAAGIDLLCQKHKIAPVKDEWGTGETNAFNVPGALPLYPVMNLPATARLHGLLHAGGGKGENKLPAVRTLRFVAPDTGVIVVNVSSPAAGQDFRASLMHRGTTLISEEYKGGKTGEFPVQAEKGKTYVFMLQDIGKFNGAYDVTIVEK